MENRKLCAILGENPDELEFGYDEEYYMCAEMKYRLLMAIHDVISMGYEHFVSSVEQGAAMWGAETCAALKKVGYEITFTAAPLTEAQADKWHPERRDRYFGVLEMADRVIDPYGDSYGVDYIMRNASYIIVLGNPELPRISELIARATGHGIEVKVI